MKYWIILKDGHYYGETPTQIPQSTFDLMVVSEHPEMKEIICPNCPWRGSITHVIEEGTGRLLCPILFVDVAKPDWKLEDIIDYTADVAEPDQKRPKAETAPKVIRSRRARKQNESQFSLF